MKPPEPDAVVAGADGPAQLQQLELAGNVVGSACQRRVLVRGGAAPRAAIMPLALPDSLIRETAQIAPAALPSP